MSASFSHRPGNAGAISLRQSVVGGKLDAGKVSPPDLLTRENRIVVLIHGFNVTQLQADKSYDEFERHLSPEVRSRLVRLYWPGDSSTRADASRGMQGRISKIISPLLYMLKPKVAVQCSKRLRALLSEAFRARAQGGRNAPLEICFVAHSLGCRLTVETLERVVVSGGSNAELPLTVLMAAAIPEYAVTGDGAFVDMIDALPQLWVLHSKADKVLRAFFRPGQLMESPLFPDFRLSVRNALGRKGVASNARVKVLEGVWDHGDYWPDGDVARAIDAEVSGRPMAGPAFAALERVVWERTVAARRTEAREIRDIPTLW